MKNKLPIAFPKDPKYTRGDGLAGADIQFEGKIEDQDHQGGEN